jgi:hypothetical protein
MSSELKITNLVGSDGLEGLTDLSHIQLPNDSELVDAPVPSIAQVNLADLFTAKKSNPRSRRPATVPAEPAKKITIRLSAKAVDAHAKPADEAATTTKASSKLTATTEPTKVFNYEIKPDQFTKEELAIRPDKEVFIQFSKVKNEELIKYFIIKYKVLEYKCLAKGCPSKNGIWRRNPMYLILIRKNNNQQDLRISNLTLTCPNCYCQDKGPSAFQRLKSVITRTCALCPRVLNQSNGGNYQYCYTCNEKLKHMNDDIRISDVIKYSIQDESMNDKKTASKKENETEKAKGSKSPEPLTRSQKARHLTSLMSEELIDTIPGPNGKPRAKRVFAVKHFGPSMNSATGGGFNEAELRTELDADLLAELDAL